MEQIEKASGRRVEAMRSVDPGLVGGLVLKAGSLEVDSSVRGRLDRLRQELVRSPLVKVRPEEITAILRKQIERYDVETDLAEVGTVLQVGDGIARVYGLESAVALEMLEFEHGVTGLAFNLEEDNVGCCALRRMGPDQGGRLRQADGPRRRACPSARR